MSHEPEISFLNFVKQDFQQLLHGTKILHGVRLNSSLVPRPHPAFHHLQYGKAVEGLVYFIT